MVRRSNPPLARGQGKSAFDKKNRCDFNKNGAVLEAFSFAQFVIPSTEPLARPCDQ
jgi:hypothetical protein